MSLARSLSVTWMTADQFMDWPGDGTGRPYQLIDGAPVAMAPPSHTHALLQATLAYVLTRELRAQRSSCRAAIGPGVRPRAGMSSNVRVPDVVVTCTQRADRYADNPTFLAEILSPSNERETREAIRALLSVPSLQDVLVLGSESATAEHLHRAPGGDWPAEPQVFGPTDTIALPSLGITLAMAELYDGLGLT